MRVPRATENVVMVRRLRAVIADLVIVVLKAIADVVRKASHVVRSMARDGPVETEIPLDHRAGSLPADSCAWSR